jgi:hypothetical protein
MSRAQPSTHLEALTAELLGDVGLLLGQIQQLREQIPALTREVLTAVGSLVDPQRTIVETTRQSIDEVRQAALSALANAAAEARPVLGVASTVSLVRDHLEQLVARLDALPQQAVAEAIAPGVTTTIEKIQRALEVIRRETEAAVGGSEHGIMQLTESGLSAVSAARGGMDVAAQQVSAAVTELRRAVGTVQQAGVEAGKASTAAVAIAAQQYETATAEVLAAAARATKAARRTTVALAVITALAIAVGAWAWRDAANGSDATRWATSPAGEAAHAFVSANPHGIALLTACDLPGWRRATINGRPACEVATGKDGRAYGWYLPEVGQ